MAGSLLQTALRRSLDQVKHVVPARSGGSDDTVARVYRQAERDFGMLAPPVALHSPAPGPLAASWMMLRESLLADGQVPRATKEAVAAAVSLGNACPYCVAVHTATLSGLLGSPTAAAVYTDNLDSIADPEVRAVAQWARRAGNRQDSQSQDAPFPKEQAPEIAGVAVTFQYLNRMVEIFLSDSPLPPAVPAMARAGMLRVLGRFMSATARAGHQPGASLELLPAAPLPQDLWWAAGSPHVAEAFARASAAIEAAGRQHVPASVQAVLRSRLAGWDGQQLGLSRSWVQEEVLGLPAGEQAAGRLALLTALAPFQVDQPVIEAFRREQPGDEALIATTSWASMSAARQVGSWLRIS
ncbi:MAG TPA: carboxymuconolactone decarboxylase family protein [Jatrophihabitans sp.]|jgi:AhpD family alkylhydroperoxidase|nr:carboxymuconolactone decarboxylase family protein [Jatrophihabitans sp.]